MQLPWRSVIGCAGRGKKPDIDLAEFDSKHAASREHAEIIVEKGGYALVPRPARINTYLNGEKVLPDGRFSLKTATESCSRSIARN